MGAENVVVLFTDIVGSTELSMSLSPDVADEVRRAHFSTLRQAIAETDGAEVKNLGDGLMVVFTSASSALNCGVAMQQGVERSGRGQTRPIGLRVGLSGGEVTREDNDYFGDPIVEAARLCGHCDGGQILATNVVLLMAGRRNAHPSQSVGAVLLRGLPDHVNATEVLWQPLASDVVESTIPLPGRLAPRPTFGVVGRLSELEVLVEAGRRVERTGDREVLLVSGEAGLGKTTLVAETARRLFDDGHCVLLGHCEEDLATPYQLFAEALGHYITYAPEDRLLAHVAQFGPELSRLTPALASRLPDLPALRSSDPESERFLLFSAVVGLLGDAANFQPVTLVLDDLQWADQGSLLLLRHLADSDRPMKVLTLGTFRDSEVSNVHPFLETLAAFQRFSNVLRIELAGMVPDEVVALIEAAAGYALDDEGLTLARALHDETDGNPFFVTEVLRHVAETGAIRQSESGRWVLDGPFDQMVLPESLREVIGVRVGRLGADQGRVLGVAAVIGRDFDLDLLSEAVVMSEDALLDILDECVAASLVLEVASRPGRYSFAHALIQHAISQDLGPARRARTHQVIGEALERLCGDRPGVRVGELARHWSSASQPANIDQALKYSCLAGEDALASLAPGDALRYYHQATALAEQFEVEDSSLTIDMTIGLGIAQRQTGDPLNRETLIQASRDAVSLNDTERLVAAVLANDRGWASGAGAVDSEKIEYLELALDRLDANHPDRALILSVLCAELTFGSELERRQALAEEALRAAEVLGDDVITVRVINHLTFPLFVPELLEASLARSAEALRLATRINDAVLLYFAAIFRADVAMRAGDIGEVDRCLALAEPLVQRLNQPALSWEFTYHRAKRAQITGDTVEAERLTTEALEIGVACGQPDAATFYGAQLAAIYWQRGSLGDLAPIIEQMVIDSPGLPTMKSALSMSYAQAGRLDEVRQLLEEFAATGYDLPHDATWLNGMTEYAEATIDLGDPQFAQPFFDVLVPWSEQFSSAGGVTAEGPVANCLGGLATILNRYDEADQYFSVARSFSDRFDARFFGAQTDLLWGQMLIARSEKDDVLRARELLTRAASIADEYGYAGIAQRSALAIERIA
jgi:class 3 adenylate cyclase